MTTIFEEEVTCGVCGSKQSVEEISSTNSFGAMDLDTRPPEMKRSTMAHWVHECEECGFVAPEFGKSVATDARRVATTEYRQALEEAAGDLVAAGWRRLHAAWACDDEGQMEESRLQRLAALELFAQARTTGQRAMKSVVGGDEVLLADVARRAGEFTRAAEFCAAALAVPEAPAFVTKLLVLQQGFIAARDTGRHTVAEAEENRKRPGSLH